MGTKTQARPACCALRSKQRAVCVVCIARCMCEIAFTQEPFMTPERIARIDKLVEWRQFGVFPLLENT